MTRLNMRGLLALFLTVLTLGLGQVPASAQVIGRVPYLSSNPCKGVTLSLAFARSTGSNCLGGQRYGSVTNVPGWTYTGGASGGSYAAKADGSLQLFANNVPRITDAGYWAEEARTNLLEYSQDFTDALWPKLNTTVSANATTAPDGSSTADLLTTTATSASIYNDTTSITPSSAYTLSFYGKANISNTYIVAILYTTVSTNGARAWFNLVDGTVSGTAVTGAGSGLSTGSQSVGNGWWRFWITVTPNGVATTLRTELDQATTSGSYATTAGGSAYIWQADLQAGSFATSPIPTTSVAVTRSADVGYVPLTGPTDGTVLVTGSVGSFTTSSGSTPILVANDVASGNSIFASGGNGNHFNGSTTIGGTGTVSLYPATNNMALTYVGTSSRSLSVNGSAVTTSATTKGPFNRVVVGQRGDLAGTQSANAPIRRIVIYPRAFGNAELQAATIGPVSFANDNAAPDDMKAALWGWVA